MRKEIHNAHSLYEYSHITDIQSLYTYIGTLAQKEFPKVDSETIKALNAIAILFCYTPSGDIPYYQIHLKTDLLVTYPELEKQIHSIMTALKEHGVKDFGLYFSDETKYGQIGLGFGSVLRTINLEKN